MNNAISIKDNGKILLTSLFDLLALTFIFYVPAISHLLSFPLYLLEPMRIIIILSLVHSSRNNSIFLAALLPVFSFVISSHPHLIKSLLISAELFLNVLLFVFISKKVSNVFASMFLSILISKLFYYIVKYFFISFQLLNSELISTPIYIQIITTIIFSAYAFVILDKNSIKEFFKFK